jgi:hypothetical protein
MGGDVSPGKQQVLGDRRKATVARLAPEESD